MPRVEVPPPRPALSDIELFAKAYFNIELFDAQKQVIAMIAAGQKPRMGKRAGVSTAEKVIREYLREGLKPGGRVRLPQHPFPPRNTIKDKKFKHLTQEGKVLALIKRPGGAYNFELSRVALKYTSVISELRKEGYAIVADRQYLKNGRASNTYRYRLAGQ